MLREAHLDTVPPGDLTNGNNNPFELTKKENKLTGLGTCDNKGNITLLLWLASLLPLKNKFSYAFHDTEPALTGQLSPFQIHQELTKYCPEDQTQNYWTQASVFEQHQIKSLVWGDADIFNKSTLSMNTFH